MPCTGFVLGAWLFRRFSLVEDAAFGAALRPREPVGPVAR
jgi:hypothetical protein